MKGGSGVKGACGKEHHAQVSVAQLRTALHSEAEAMKELLAVVDDQSAALKPVQRNPHKDTRRRKLVTALSHVGGEDLQRARMEVSQSADRLYQVAAEVDRHNAEIQALPLLRGLFRRRAMLRRAEELEAKRRAAMADYEQARQRADALFRSLATPENISEVIRVSREMRSRVRVATNTRKHLSIKKRLLLDNLNLCEEIDSLLCLLKPDEKIAVHETDVQELIHDDEFKSSLRDRVSSEQRLQK
ncbi:hypothetical protein FHR99_001826 [Litorivivens lipolytica]|uniref:Uncharacterized protein n=1 Tax=Litorivivens lipolytica TaxID=1524264 RepID=A0A7W4W507_9GAMM|nr:hypothetical protein [Litorivivens lipolytica]MBB3047560.1 hypothetical protein [Litorivivens lipolytica]